MKALVLVFLFLNFTATNLFSQQCGYDDYYLFVLHVHAKDSMAKVPGLKMFLVDEDEKPVLTSVTYLEDQQWNRRSDTLFFWEHELLQKGPGTRPLFRQKFFNLGDYYVVAFRLDAIELQDPRTYPIYKVKIEKALNRWPNETMLIHLPLSKAVRICNNGITGDFPLVKPVQMRDGRNFEPIDIVLDQPDEVKPVEEGKDELQYAVRFDHQTISTPIEGMNEYLLNGARIYDTQTGQLHQEIYIPRITKSSRIENNYVVKFIDFYNRGITEAKDFSVQIESWRDLEIKGYRQKLNYYIFNPTTKQYELDTTLSNYNDVFYYEPLKIMRRYDFEVTAKSRIIYTYQLENKKWVVMDTSEAFFEPPPPKIKYPSSNCIVVNGNEHVLPVKAVPGTDATIMVKDTFWLYNTCDDTLYITKVESSTRDFFSINQTLLPKQQSPVIFNGLLTNNGYDFHINRFFCSLTLTDGSIVGLGSMIPTVSNNATVYYRSDSSVHYAVGSRPQARFTIAVFTYPSGQLRAQGMVQDKDTSLKVGSWLYFKEGSIGSDNVQYSKAISLSAFDDTNGLVHNKFKVRILEKGSWKEPIADYDNHQVKFFINPQTDSIIAFTDSTSYGIALSYKKLPSYINKEFYLLKPNERTLKIGQYEMPFEVVNNQYAVILNYSYLKSNNKTTYELMNDYITALREQYPDISTVWISKNQRGVSLQDLEDETRAKVLQQMMSDSCVSVVCQLFYTNRNPQRLSYCDNKVIAEIDIDTEYPEKFRRTALKLGYSSIETDSGNNRFWLTYPSKLIDEGFFEAFDRLTKEKLVLGAYLNSYFEPVEETK